MSLYSNYSSDLCLGTLKRKIANIGISNELTFVFPIFSSTVVIFCPVCCPPCSSSLSCECLSSATTSCLHCPPPYTPSHTSDSWYYTHTLTNTCAHTVLFLTSTVSFFALTRCLSATVHFYGDGGEKIVTFHRSFFPQKCQRVRDLLHIYN